MRLRKSIRRETNSVAGAQYLAQLAVRFLVAHLVHLHLGWAGIAEIGVSVFAGDCVRHFGTPYVVNDVICPGVSDHQDGHSRV